jgi:hypothetical protein
MVNTVATKVFPAWETKEQLTAIMITVMGSCKTFGLDLLESMDRAYETAIANGADDKMAEKAVATASIYVYPAPIEAR